jgi:hypothetical protein
VNTKMKVTAALPMAAAALLPAGAALAEQTQPFTWTLVNASPGSQSPVFDPNRNVTTYVTVNSCRSNYPVTRNITLQLTRREPPWKPATNMGVHTYPCGQKTQWARSTPDADYHLSLSKINGTDNSGGTGYRAWGSVRVAW